MSGSPLFIENNNNGEFYVVGVHHGLLKGEKDKTGGVYLTEEAQAQIYQWCGKEPSPTQSQPPLKMHEALNKKTKEKPAKSSNK